MAAGRTTAPPRQKPQTSRNRKSAPQGSEASQLSSLVYHSRGGNAMGVWRGPQKPQRKSGLYCLLYFLWALAKAKACAVSEAEKLRKPISAEGSLYSPRRPRLASERIRHVAS